MLLCYASEMKKYKCSSSSKRWLCNHFSDQYVQESKKIQVRSRAWFKIDQIHNVDFLFCSGMFVLDLGSAPGSWSEYAKKKIGRYGRIISCDILPMRKIIGVDFLQGDFCDHNILNALILGINGKKVDIVLSDMCPNLTGKSNIDIPRLIHLGELALYFCKYVLVSGGTFLVKGFQGEGFNEYFSSICSSFGLVKIRKPYASCTRSREVYIVAKNYKV